MFPIVRISLGFLRFATHASLFIEAQRVLLRIIRPVRRDYLECLEKHILGRVRAQISHHYISTGIADDKLHILEASLVPESFVTAEPAQLSALHAAGGEQNALSLSVPLPHLSPPSPPLSSSSSSSCLSLPLEAMDGRRLRQPVAVLLHGHSMSATFWFRNVDDFCSLGYRVLAVDLLGWGKSSRPRRRILNAENAVDYYVKSLNGALSRLNLGPVLLVGHSLGGYVALEYTRRYPEDVQSLILVSPAACTREISLSRAIYFCLPPQRLVRRGGLLGYLLFVHLYPRLRPYMADRLRDYTYHLATQPAGGECIVPPLIGFHFPTRRAYCTRPLVDNLTPIVSTPVQIIVGEKDSSMPVQTVHDLYSAMMGAGYNVRLNVVKNSDHCPQLEQPKTFFSIVTGFVKSSCR